MAFDLSSTQSVYRYDYIQGDVTGFTTFIIPYWVDAAIQRNRLNYMSLKDISLLGQYVSLNEMAEILFMSQYHENTPLNTKSSALRAIASDSGFLSWLEGGGESADRPIVKLSRLPNLQLGVLDRLMADQDDSCKAVPVDPIGGARSGEIETESAVKEFYKINVVDRNTVVVVLQKGIVNKLGDKEYSKGFLSAYLRALYSICSVDEVAHTSAFYEYVSRL